MVFCGKNVAKLDGVAVRPAAEALLDQAAAMLSLGAVALRPRTGPFGRVRKFFARRAGREL